MFLVWKRLGRVFRFEEIQRLKTCLLILKMTWINTLIHLLDMNSYFSDVIFFSPTTNWFIFKCKQPIYNTFTQTTPISFLQIIRQVLYFRMYKNIYTKWKLGKITALHKKGNTAHVGNYRPVSLTCVIGKWMETIIRNHITNHMTQQSLFSNKLIYPWSINIITIT